MTRPRTLTAPFPTNTQTRQHANTQTHNQQVARYHAPAVKAGMTRLAIAQEQHRAACRAAWASFLSEFGATHHAACRRAVAALAQLDALCALAAVSRSPGYSRPAFAEEGGAPRLVITGGRHPVLDLALAGGAVPNDVELRWDGRRGAIVTGGLPVRVFVGGGVLEWDSVCMAQC